MLADLPLGPPMVKTGLGAQPGPSYAAKHSRNSQKLWIACSCGQVAESQARAHLTLLAPEDSWEVQNLHTSVQLQPHQSRTQRASLFSFFILFIFSVLFLLLFYFFSPLFSPSFLFLSFSNSNFFPFLSFFLFLFS